MRIFERLSRRLAITLAGVMACSTFAIPVAPAITAYAEGEQEAAPEKKETGEGMPSFTEDYAKWEASAVELKNGADYQDAAWGDPWGSVIDGDAQTDYYLDTFKINAPEKGTLKINIDSVATVNIGVWKKGDTQQPSIYATAGEEEKGIGQYKLFGDNGKAIEAGEYYMVVITKDKDSKFRVKAEVTVDIKKTKVKVSSPAKKTVKATIKKAKKVDGYEFAYGTKKEINDKTKYKAVKASKIKFDKDKNGSYELKKLKSGKVYWVRVRTYVVEDGVKYYSDWSAVKKVKVK